MKILVALLVLIIAVVSLASFSNKAQVYLLYKMYSLGGGLDDGATELFVNNKQRYKKIVLGLLNAENPDSYSAQASFIFAELLLDDPDIDQRVRDIAENHKNKYIRCFWSDVINGRFQQVRISDDNSSEFAAYVIKDNGSKCE